MAVGRILAGILILMIYATTIISSLGPCEPDCTGVKDLGQVVDPLNCTNYYTCINQEPLEHSTPCPSGQIFNPQDLACINGTNCTSPCEGGGGSGTCNLTCLEGVEGINDPFDCSIYYECGPVGPGNPQVCPANIPNYDSTANKCVNDASVCCVPGCIGNCTEVPSLIPDPYDCTSYYLCGALGPPTEDFHFQCAKDEYFDIGSGRCSTTSECQIWCQKSTTGSGGSSIPMTSPAVPMSTTDCVESWTCDATGNFPKCSFCQPEFFVCSQIGQPGTLKTCSNGYLFNTDPAYPACVLATSCPYHGH